MKLPKTKETKEIKNTKNRRCYFSLSREDKWKCHEGLEAALPHNRCRNHKTCFETHCSDLLSVSGFAFGGYTASIVPGIVAVFCHK